MTSAIDTTELENIADLTLQQFIDEYRNNNNNVAASYANNLAADPKLWSSHVEYSGRVGHAELAHV